MLSVVCPPSMTFVTNMFTSCVIFFGLVGCESSESLRRTRPFISLWGCVRDWKCWKFLHGWASTMVSVQTRWCLIKCCCKGYSVKKIHFRCEFSINFASQHSITILWISDLVSWQDLVLILEAMRIIAIALSPVTPRLSWRIYAQLGYSKDQFDAATWVSFSFYTCLVFNLLLYV